MLSRREAQLLRTLRRRKTRDAERLFLVEGVRAVEELAASSLAVRLVAAASSVGDTDRGRRLLERLAGRGVPVREAAEREVAEASATETPQGIVAVVEMPSGSLPESSAAAGSEVLLLLDAVQDPGNLGTLARTAEALGAAAVVLLPGTVDPWNPKSVRAAMGATFRLPVVQAGWEVLGPWLEGAGYEILAAAAGGEPLGPVRAPRTALVLGNEGAGVSAETLRRAHRRVGIPLRGRAESLNVAAAGAILLHDLLR